MLPSILNNANAFQTSNKKNDRLQYGDFQLQMSEHSEHFIMLLLASHQAVCDLVFEVLFNPTGDRMEDVALTRRDKVLLEEGSSPVSPQHPDTQREISQMYKHVFCEDQGLLPVPHNILRSDDLGLEVLQATQEHEIIFVGGDCGAGKSVGTPHQLLNACHAWSPHLAAGLIHVLPNKLGAESLQSFIHGEAKDLWNDRLISWNQRKALLEMCCLWNGDQHQWPTSRVFWMLCTPASLFNRIAQGNRLLDVRYIIFDELHTGDGLALLLLFHFVMLAIQKKIL